ncbi:MAG TPA: aminoglycoside phosphotransferase family protein [Blastocatellia bacterium]|nr:aminoglycoside phosphotransferase family protein [Blastocatellia bacterium]
MITTTGSQVAERLQERIRDWNVIAEKTLETESSVIVLGSRAGQPVVLKVARQAGDEWRCGAVLKAFGGRGLVQCVEFTDGAALLERLIPGTSLAELALSGRDQEAIEILAKVISEIHHPLASSQAFPTVQDWGNGFRNYLASGDGQIPRGLVEQGLGTYASLCASQRTAVLLHGDLQHYNVLFDNDRGWTAIDPKGVVGEIEYEVGASLRNPVEKPELFVSPGVVERRLKVYESRLKLDPARMLGWSFAQAVLSAIWSVEDGFAVDAANPAIMLANAIREITGSASSWLQLLGGKRNEPRKRSL